jgi:hypothetical protein
MKTNIGSIDRVIRIVVGVGVLGAGCYFKTWWGLVGLLPLVTAIVRVCPAYLLFGLSTCGERSKPSGEAKP